jgi:hypothetical protein
MVNAPRAKQAKHTTTRKIAKATANKNARSKSKDSGRDSDESRHNLETLSPRNNAMTKIVNKNASPNLKIQELTQRSQCMTWTKLFLVKRSRLLRQCSLKT